MSERRTVRKQNIQKLRVVEINILRWRVLIHLKDGLKIEDVQGKLG